MSDAAANVPDLTSITFRVNSGPVPSFKNRKRAIREASTGKLRTLTPGSIKKRMDRLENAIVCELFSMSRTIGGGTPSECSKRLRTFLSGLCDDSILEIPCGEWDVEQCAPGLEGISITIALS